MQKLNTTMSSKLIILKDKNIKLYLVFSLTFLIGLMQAFEMPSLAKMYFFEWVKSLSHA